MLNRQVILRTRSAVTTVNITRDDAGLYSLKTANSTPVTARAVTAVPPYGEREPGESRSVEPVPVRERRRGERRRGERRADKAPVVLDTRSKHERRARSHGRRTEDRASTEPRAANGINIYI